MREPSRSTSRRSKSRNRVLGRIRDSNTRSRAERTKGGSKGRIRGCRAEPKGQYRAESGETEIGAEPRGVEHAGKFTRLAGNKISYTVTSSANLCRGISVQAAPSLGVLLSGDAFCVFPTFWCAASMVFGLRFYFTLYPLHFTLLSRCVLRARPPSSPAPAAASARPARWLSRAKLLVWCSSDAAANC